MGYKVSFGNHPGKNRICFGFVAIAVLYAMIAMIAVMHIATATQAYAQEYIPVPHLQDSNPPYEDVYRFRDGKIVSVTRVPLLPVRISKNTANIANIAHIAKENIPLVPQMMLDTARSRMQARNPDPVEIWTHCYSSALASFRLGDPPLPGALACQAEQLPKITKIQMEQAALDGENTVNVLIPKIR